MSGLLARLRAIAARGKDVPRDEEQIAAENGTITEAQRLANAAMEAEIQRRSAERRAEQNSSGGNPERG